ncbi:MAG TPA: DUF6349 family protein [Actinospica sp.]|jgi:N12 class adenine-specific DNA methylase|nr:DUF6349 family protein [Actinospica sp.]
MAEFPAETAATRGAIGRARASLTALETLERLRQAPHIPPTPDDLAALRGWSGWGPLAPALESTRSGTWEQIGQRINYLLPSEHFNEGMQATYNAFYTPPEIASACWKILTDLGFAGGDVLEPGCGAGAFIAHSPSDLPVRWTGVERDPTTAAIAAKLHPDATIRNQRFEATSLPSASMDAVIGNIPFGDVAVYDPTAPPQVSRSLHNYFIWRSIQALKPGGIAVLLTSRYTLDAYGEDAMATRIAIAWDADLLGAIRLPNSAHSSSGTEALTDVLVLRRRRPDEPRDENNRPTWIKTGLTVGQQPINEYFLANPRMVLGELAEDRAPRYGRTLRVDPRPDDPPLPLALTSAGEQIVERAGERGRTWRVVSGVAPISAETAPFELRADGKKEGSFHLVEGVVHEVIDAKLTPVARAGTELPKLVALRDAVVGLLDAEADHSRPDADLEPLRAETNRLYDAYVRAHGYLNRYTVVEGKPDEDGVVQVSRRRPTMGGFRRDPDFVTVLALEDFDDETRTAAKAALLNQRVNRPRERAARAENAIEAVALCRDELGQIDPERIAELLGVEIAEAEQKLAEIAYLDPETGTWMPEDEYLTGNVRTKLAQAKTAAASDPQLYGRNVPALEAAQPTDLEPEQIHANLGAPWIPATDVQKFAEELLEFPITVWNEPRTSTWTVATHRRAEESAAATSEWGTARLNAYRLLEAGLNGKAPVVYDLIDDKRVRNQDETIAANDRLDAIAARFSTWVWEDPERADRLAAAYNRSFNAVVPRKFDGSHLTFPSLDPAFEPYAHQRDMVARMIAGSDALCPYPVGTGKTATMFMAATKLKALGLAQKPLIIVTPATLEQIARDGKRLLPNARILMAGKEDLRDARARKLFAARCAMEDWDAVVMSHPSFTSLPVHATVQAAYVSDLADEYRTALISAAAAEGSQRKIKQIAKMVDRLEAEGKSLLTHATDDGVFFEHLGVDYLLVDELHYFKNLGVPVHTDGFTIQSSKRAQDLDMKISWLRRQHPDHAVVTGFTGTPVSNTLLEAFVIQHYLQPKRLDELGIASADAWAANFVSFKTAVELCPDGSFRLNRRPAEIVNIPEMMHTLGEVAELRPPEAFPVKRPGVRRHNVAVEASETVLDFVQTLADRADAIHAGGVSPDEDNMLAICSDGRKVALHESLVGLVPDGPGKVDKLVENVARIYHETKNQELPGGQDPGIRGRLQLVFCDLGTPNKTKGNQVYGLIRQGLIAAGVPAAMVRFIHEATTDTRRLVLFDQCNKGEVAVLLGSTDKLGVGVNVQRRAIALHHVDAPWRPDQVEQRDGRVWRPKNLNPDVEIYRYVTEGSFDAFMWQALERKEKSLRPILSGQITARTVEDIGDVALDYGQIKAISTGNPLLAEMNEVNVEVKRLASLAASHQRAQRRLRNDIQMFTMQAAHATQTADALDAVAKTAASTPETSAWTDRRGTTIRVDDVAAVLAALAESTITRGFCDGTMKWRSLEIDFTYSKTEQIAELAARIATEQHRITVPMKAGWAAKGQHWRILDAITAAVRDADQVAEATRENIADLNRRIAENEAMLGTPFPEAEALEAARAHRTALDAAIREQADHDEEARRNRKARTAALLGQPKTPADERKELLARMHAAMVAVAARVESAQDPEPQNSVQARQTATISVQIAHEREKERQTPESNVHLELHGAAQSPEQSAGTGLDTSSVQASPAPVPQEQPAEPEPLAVAHRTNYLRKNWHPPLSAPVDKNPYNNPSVYTAFCKDCSFTGPWHGEEEEAQADMFDHAFPGWRELVPVVASMQYEETQNKKAVAQWRQTIVDLYPAGWVEAGGPVLMARERGGTRWHDDSYLGGNYSVCGVERAIRVSATARHKGRTRLVAASYQPREKQLVQIPHGPIGVLTAEDTTAALAGIFTPGKLLALSTALQDKATLKAWLKTRAQASRDEHVGRRPAAADQPRTFDSVTETRQGLEVVVITDAERREGLITWPQAAEHLRTALTPGASLRLSELYEVFQSFYNDPLREIEPTLTALRTLREHSSLIHQAAAAHLAESPADAEAPAAAAASRNETPKKTADAPTPPPAAMGREFRQVPIEFDDVTRDPQQPKVKEQSEMFEHAIDLALQGLAVFPLKPGTKRPMFRDWERLASTDPEQITRWWSATPNANIAIACGPSNLLVIDLDKAKKPGGGPRHGQNTLLELAAGRGIPATYTVASARGGRHLYYRQPEGSQLGNTAGSLGPLLDTRGHGGFVVAPGSTFEGGTYRVEREASIAELPAWIVEELDQRRTTSLPNVPETAPSTGSVSDRRRTAYGTAALRRSASTIASAHEGTRNDTLNRESFRIGRLVGGSVIDRDTAYSMLYRAARKSGLPPGECAMTITSGLAAGMGRPRFIPSHGQTPRSEPQATTKETPMSTTTDEERISQTASATAEREDNVPAPEVEQPDADAIDINEAFADTVARLTAAKNVDQDVSEFSNHDELKRAIDELREVLAQVPTLAGPAPEPEPSHTDPANPAPEPVDPGNDPEQLPGNPAADLDEHLAAVDAAYAEAEVGGTPAAEAEWAGIRAVHSAVHHLWEVVKAAAGTYWAELAADARAHGLLSTLATRACRAIANLATAAADRIAHDDPTPSPAPVSNEPGLREAFINARNNIRVHAASYEWQRIAALWGTVNTLSRQTDDPNIRAVVAHSADAISDFASTLADKVTHYGNEGNVPAVLEMLACAAEQHATSLNPQSHEAVQVPTAALAPAAGAPHHAAAARSTPAVVDGRAMQEAARRVAQRAQRRIDVPARAQGGNALRSPTSQRSDPHHGRQQYQAMEQQRIVPGI